MRHFAIALSLVVLVGVCLLVFPNLGSLRFYPVLIVGSLVSAELITRGLHRMRRQENLLTSRRQLARPQAAVGFVLILLGVTLFTVLVEPLLPFVPERFRWEWWQDYTK